jgi:DNA-binding PadR family transcriptional regulator
MDIRTLCLGMLSMREASGYEIKKMVEGPLRHFFDASYGSIYPALNRLTREGLVQATAYAQEKRPDKKVYRLTPMGRLAFMEELMRMPGRDRFRSEFIATLLFADLLPAAHLAKVIDARINEYRGCITEIEARAGESQTAGQRFVHGLGLAVYSAALAYLEDNRHLVEGEALLATAGR